MDNNKSKITLVPRLIIPPRRDENDVFPDNLSSTYISTPSSNMASLADLESPSEQPLSERTLEYEENKRNFLEQIDNDVSSVASESFPEEPLSEKAVDDDLNSPSGTIVVSESRNIINVNCKDRQNF